jgi:hypothetical protein
VPLLPLLLHTVSQKPPSDEELEALLKLAESPAQPGDKIEPMDSVNHWILALGIKPGNDKVRAHTLWYCYQKWAKEPVTANYFYKCIKKLIGSQYRQSDKYHYYRLDKSALGLTEEEEADINAARRSIRHRELSIGVMRRENGYTRKKPR